MGVGRAAQRQSIANLGIAPELPQTQKGRAAIRPRAKELGRNNVVVDFRLTAARRSPGPAEKRLGHSRATASLRSVRFRGSPRLVRMGLPGTWAERPGPLPLSSGH